MNDDLTDEQTALLETEHSESLFLALLDICQQTLAFSPQLYRQEHLIKDLNNLKLPNTLIEILCSCFLYQDGMS